ncbi:MAG: NAD(P)H-hydrate dehydratase [Acidobacteria bacterium]|nr:NAD(P)H-hydrate dehydratase [Acidobacteriota bacterium]
MKILTARQMREVDRLTTEKFGVPSLVLMENAGRNVFHLIQQKFPVLQQEQIAILCGKGNNGGDGFVVARQLLMRGYRPRVFLLADPASLKGDAKVNYEILVKAGWPPAVVRDFKDWAAIRSELLTSTLLVDALLGTGLEGPVEGFYLEVIRDLNAHFAHIPIIAVDMPSGLPSDTGQALGESLKARYTVTFTAPKWSHIFPPNCERVGELFVTPIGTPASTVEEDPSIFLNLLGDEILTGLRAKRHVSSHKGNYGHVLVVGGSRGMSGAAALAAMGALSAGTALVTAAVPSSILPLVAGVAPVLMTEPLPENDHGTISTRAFDNERFARMAEGKSVLAIGPGITTHPDTVEFVRRVVREYSQLPVVVDADGLNAFTGAAELLQGEGRKLILTPHPGEMARLTGLSTKEIQSKRVEVVREFAVEHKAYVVLKGYRTLIAEPGGQLYVNSTGNPGMATAGTGDVLAGIIAGLLAQYPEMPVERVVSTAVYWHGAAGDVAAARKGELSLLSTDLIDALPEALRAPEETSRNETAGTGRC